MTDYTQLLPVLTSPANLSSYSQYIFSAMDNEKTGVINFEVKTVFVIYMKTDKLSCYEKDFALELSILLLGTVEDKLRWMFKLYDLNKVKHEIPLSKID